MMLSKKEASKLLFVSVLRKISLFFGLLFYSASPLAHVKWFIQDDSQFEHLYYPMDWISLTIIGITLSFLALASILDRVSRFNLLLNKLMFAPPIPHLINRPGGWANDLLKQSIAIALLANLLQGHFVAPHFVVNGGDYIYVLIQVVLILILILNVNLFSLSLILFSLYLLVSFPFHSSIDYVPELLTIGLAMFFTDKSRKNNKYILRFTSADYSVLSWDLGLAILRLGLGIQLIILTFHDKLLNPGYGLAFLVEYPYFNFPRYFGFEFLSDVYFLLCAGMVELSLGVLLVANVIPRLALIMIIFIFSLTGFIMGFAELAGHIPIIVAAMVLFLGLSQKSVFMLDKERTELLAE